MSIYNKSEKKEHNQPVLEVNREQKNTGRRISERSPFYGVSKEFNNEMMTNIKQINGKQGTFDWAL